MREPTEEGVGGKGKTAGKASKGAPRGGRRGASAAPRPSRPRIPGGKVVARLLYFEQQREAEVAEDGRKEVCKTPTQSLVQSSGREAAPPRAAAAGRRAAARGGAAARRGAQAVAPEGRRFAAFAHKAELETAAAPTPVAQSWRPIGPFSMPHGQTYGSGPGSRPSVSGRVSSIAVDPGNPDHILIGAGGGGVWETRDGGKNWSPRTDDQPSLAIGAVAFNPSNPSIVYAGTGEGDSTFANSPNLLGTGLLRSQDGGATWQVHTRAPFEQVGFYDILVDPTNGNHLLAATTIGLFESTNGGTAWTQRRAQRTWKLSMHPPVPGNAAAGREVFAACSDGVFRSTNGGQTWSAVALPGATTQFRRIEVCHAPSNGNVVYVFSAGSPEVPDPVAAAQGFNDTMPKPRLWRRSIFGGAFTAVNSLPPDLQTGQAWYDWFAAVAPNNPDVLYVAGINVHRGVRTASGAFNWRNISAKTAGDSIHPDQHAIAFSPQDPNVVYVGNDGGIYASPDAGTTWRSLNKGLCITEIEFLAQHPQFEAWLLAGTQDNGTIRYQGDEVWYHVADGDGGDCGVNAATPHTCYHTFFGMGVARSKKGGGWQTWPLNPQLVGPPATGGEDYPSGALFYPPVEVRGRVVVQAGVTVFISGDDGTSWTRVPLPSGEVASALAIPTTMRVYVGTARGRVFRIEFAGGQWGAPVALTRPAAGFVSDIVVDPTNPNRIFVTYQSSQTGSHVFRSDNDGGSWINISQGLPVIPINAVEIDPANPDRVYVAADVGVYRSLDAGQTWAAFSPGLPNALVKDLLFHQPSRLLRAGTQARGVWEINVDEATAPNVEVYLRDSAVDTGRQSPSPSGVNDPFNSGAQTFWFQSPDIKVDSPSYQRPALDDVDFEVFGDDQSMVGIWQGEAGIQFARGLMHENPQRSRVARVYVRVHNRGTAPAANVAVKVFFAAAAVSFPPLPANFWANFPNNVVPASSPWQPIASHKVVARIEGGQAQIVGFEWPVPAAAPTTVALLAIVSADNDSISETELNISALVRGNKKCGLKNMTLVNPSPMTGPPVGAVHLPMHPSGVAGAFALEVDRAAVSRLRGLVFSKRLSKMAKKAGLKLLKLSEEDQAEIARIVESDPSLGRTLDVRTVYAPRRGALLEGVTFEGRGPEQLIALLNPNAASGNCSIIQRSEDGTVLGGFTFKVK